MPRMVTLFIFVLVASTAASEAAVINKALGQSSAALTPIQREIERQRQRLSSAEAEERRDALMKLGNLKRPDASRVAVTALNDPIPIVRATAAHAILSLPQLEAGRVLLPLLQDKSEFVRRETAYALGETRSRSAVEALSNLLVTDKQAGVRAAAAVALGRIGDEAAVAALSQLLSGTASSKKKKKKKKALEGDFVLRAAARSLGQIRSRAGVPILIATLENETNPADVRREAATALGLIGDASAAPSLRSVLASTDPYVAEAASKALRRMRLPRN